ncbi:hypothetical protein tpqmel_0440 [Candidatus Gastranaerophilus sp. (ex Termes propinquus)]|nr:hypothetical protein tpqmel_0440 [Candidatus Gastranaerophilus sp. (ex Termes propinquus)]
MKRHPKENRLFTEAYAIPHAYLEDYAKRLYKAYDTRKSGILFSGYGQKIEFILHRDGNVSDIEVGHNLYYWKTDKDPELDKSQKYVIDIIRRTPAKPFPEGFDDDSIWVKVFFFKIHFDRIELTAYPKVNLKSRYTSDRDKKFGTARAKVSMNIDKNHKKRKHTTPSVIPYWGSGTFVSYD